MPMFFGQLQTGTAAVHLKAAGHIHKGRVAGAASPTDASTAWQSTSSPSGAFAQVPLFPGDCELRQLLHIFKLLGTPTEMEWEGVSQLRDWHEFPNWRKQSLAEHFPALEAAGVDLLDAMFIYNPALRITVRPLFWLYQPHWLFLAV